jgi:hypothetical protein
VTCLQCFLVQLSKVEAENRRKMPEGNGTTAKLMSATNVTSRSRASSQLSSGQLPSTAPRHQRAFLFGLPAWGANLQCCQPNRCSETSQQTNGHLCRLISQCPVIHTMGSLSRRAFLLHAQRGASLRCNVEVGSLMSGASLQTVKRQEQLPDWFAEAVADPCGWDGAPGRD